MTVETQARLLWAKSEPPHALWRHLLDAAAVCLELVPRFGTVAPLTAEWTALLVALHDIGKADAWFQNKVESLAGPLRQAGLIVPEWKPGEKFKSEFRHEARSAEWLLRWLKTQGWSVEAAKVARKAVEGHHGDWQPQNYGEEKAAARWNPLRDELARIVCAVLRPQPLEGEPLAFAHQGAAGAKLSGLIVLCDWIASNSDLFHVPNLPDAEPPEYFAAARDEARRAVARMQFDALPDSERIAPSFAQVWPQIDVPRPLQSALDARRNDLPPGLCIIEAPTGEGKTEAAVYLAECWNARAGQRGAYLALPTQATANAMHERYQKFLARWRPDVAPRLLHGMAWLQPGAAPSAKPQTGGDPRIKSRDELLAREWFRPMRRALLAPEGVGTVDQALLAAMAVRFGFLRLLGLGQKVLIVDEVHAYDEYMTIIMERLLAWCRACGVSVMLLSATLSRAQKHRLCAAFSGPSRQSEVEAFFEARPPSDDPYPLLTFVPFDAPIFEMPVEADSSRATTIYLSLEHGLLEDAAATARLALDATRNGGCACVLANTVRAAQEIFQALQRLRTEDKTGVALDDDGLMLFHARFPAHRRATIEKRVVTMFGPDAGQQDNPPRPRRAILVATQVVEQSLDVDFDVMLSQLAPVDLLLQRAGRLWRHRRDGRPIAAPVLHVLLPPQGSLDFGVSECRTAGGKGIYAREIMLRTFALLHQKATCGFKLPHDFRPLVEACYGRDPMLGDVVTLEELDKAAIERDKQRADNASQANSHLLPDPERGFEMTRRGATEAQAEDDPGARSYFVAQTRLGDDSRAALLLNDPALIALAKSDLEEASKPRHEQRAPGKEQLKELFAHKVNLPEWWLNGAVPLEGYEAFWQGEAWLRGHIVLPLHEGEWRGQDKTGRAFCLRDDPTLGVTRAMIGQMEQGATDAEAEADAGHAA